MLHTIDEVEAFFHKRDRLGIKPGLERVHLLLERLEHPEKKIKTIHVAGTNGKGSTIQFIQESLLENNYVVGVFTSPSFIGLCGYFLINKVPATEENIIELVNKLMPYIEELDVRGDAPTTFEIITVMAFAYFADKVDIAIVETGMGGRFDTTNCFLPEIAVITNISMDHMHFLGNHLTDIAWHKAGIIKKNTPVVLGRIEDKESIDVFENESKKKHAPTYKLGRDFHYKKSNDSVLTWCDDERKKNTFSLQMKGDHQVDNAVVAYMVLRLLKQQGLTLQIEKINEGMKTAKLPGRFETIHSNPVMVLDCAHNLAGIKAFLTTLDQSYTNYRKILLFAGFQDKQLQKMLQTVEPFVDELMLTTFDHPRAASLETLENISLNTKRKIAADWMETVTSILRQTEEKGTMYCVTGSLHFITEVRRFLKGENAPNL